MVKTAVKVADVVKNTSKSQAEIKFDYKDYCSTKELTNPNARVYILVTDGTIRKIGYSESQGGIKSTLSAYQGGLGGSPSLRTFGIHKLLSRAVKDKKKPEVYMIMSESVTSNVKGLFGVKKNASVRISGKSMEDICMEDYLSKESKRPEWNIQETEDRNWPNHIVQAWRKHVGKDK